MSFIGYTKLKNNSNDAECVNSVKCKSEEDDIDGSLLVVKKGTLLMLPRVVLMWRHGVAMKRHPKSML